MQDKSHIPLPKLRPPRLGPGSLERPRLLARLDDGLAKPLTLLGAPAGYGKTTLLAQWVARQDHPFAWLTLDSVDNDPGVLLEEIAAAVRTLFPDCCQSVAALLSGAGPFPISVMSRELVNDLDDLDEFILILDDFQNLADPESLEIVRTLISHPPRSLHIVIASRADPLLPLGAMRGRGLMNEVRAAELRFNGEEATEYLEAAFGQPLAGEQLSSLLARTEGWIAGLHLAALSLSGREDLGKGIDEFAGSDRYIVEYLMDELLTQLAPSVDRFLLATSVLDRLSASLCRAVTGEGELDSFDGRPLLEWLEDSNLFVVSLDERREWFRYHHLFRDVLRRSLLAQSSFKEIAELHLRAAKWLSDHDLVDDALGHFLQAKRPDLAADALERHGLAAIDHEGWLALERWMGTIGPDVIDSRPRLVLFHAWLAHMRQDMAGMVRHCERAERLIEQREATLGDEAALRGEISAMRSQVSFRQGAGEVGLAYAREAQESLPPDRHFARATAGIFEGGNLHLLGRNEEALEVLRAYSFGDYGRPIHPRVMLGLCFLAVSVGDVDSARTAAEVMLAEATRRGLWESAGWARYFLGLAAYLRNDLATAEEHYSAVEPYACHIIPVKQAFYGLAWVRFAQGRPEEALEVMERLRSIVAELNIPLQPEIRLVEGRLAALWGRSTYDTMVARDFAAAGNRGPLSLQLCYEFSPITAIAILAVQGGDDELRACQEALGHVLSVAEVNGNVFRSVECLLLQALVYDRQDRNAQALSSVAAAVGMARRGHMIRLFPDMGERMLTLLQALRIRGGTDPFLGELIASFPGQVAAPSAGNPPGADPRVGYLEAYLTNREIDVLLLLEQRLSNKEIAKRLFISTATVKRHTLNIYSKLGVGGRREAAAKARQLGMLPDSP